MKKGNPPIIVIGMHRSGTTLLTEILQQWGVFMGKKMFKNREAIFFQDINKWLLFQASSTWDRPNTFQDINPEFIPAASRAIKWQLKNYKRYEFLGLSGAIKHSSVEQLKQPWGWKDPVNSITLNLWMELFPEAKIINIVRNPVDVAASLKFREEKRIEQYSKRKELTVKEKRMQKRPVYGQSYRVLNIEEGIDLAIEYMKLNQKHCERYKEQSVTLVYEQLMAKPEQELQKIIDLTGLSITKLMLENSVNTIDSKGAYKFVENVELLEVFHKKQLNLFFEEFGFDQP